MARYYLVRGWLECAHEDIPHVRELILRHWSTAAQSPVLSTSAELYRKAWMFPGTNLNWTGFIYFGADIKAEALGFVRDCLLLVSKSGLEVDGYFHVDDEEEEDLRCWLIQDHKLVESVRVPRPPSE